MMLFTVGCYFPLDIHRFKYYGNYQNSTPNSHHSLRTDGYYFHSSKDSLNSSLVVFYEGGLLFKSPMSKYHESLLDRKSPNLLITEDEKNRPEYWGSYMVVNDTVRMQKFLPLEKGRFFASDEEYWLIIENDSSLRLINYFIDDRPSFTKKMSIQFKFNHCASIPDSMNILLKIKDEEYPDL